RYTTLFRSCYHVCDLYLRFRHCFYDRPGNLSHPNLRTRQGCEDQMSPQRYRIGLIGEHIATSLSPMIHSAEAKAQGLDDFHYDLIELAGHLYAEDQLGPIIHQQAAGDFTGFNVTHPHKQHVIAYLDGLSNTARKLGAVNNIIHTAAGWIGHNTDHSGFLAGLHNMLPAEDRKSVVLGRDGRAR